jgi:branched-chain amino acid transport system permease protein
MARLSALDSPNAVLADTITLAATGAAAAALAFAGTAYIDGVVVLFMINAILVTSYRTITAMGGWSFAHVAIMGVGAYATAILTTGAGAIGVLPALAAGGICAGLVAALLAWPVLRTRQYYFFLSTFAAGEALRQAFIQARDLTGGTSGIAFIPRPALLDATSTHQFIWLTLAVFLLLGAFYVCFDASETGLKIRAVAEDEALASALGMNAWAHRATAFVLGSVGAGVAGGLLASYNGIVAPSDFGAAAMFKIVAACIVGGTARLYGPILGLLFLTLVEEAFRGVPVYVPFLWGALVIAAVLYAPAGLAGLVDRLVAERRNA